MILVLIGICSVLWFLIRYSGWLLSWFLSVFFRCNIRVGGVRWLSLLDVRVRLPGGTTLHLDSCSLQFFPQQVSKPLLISLGDVRIEADPLIFAGRKTGEKEADSDGQKTKTNTSSIGSRVAHVVQYCGLCVTSVHVVLLDAVPDCMIHVTVDELSMETFRSRDGWQVEIACRLAQGKALRRRGATGRPLADFALLFQLSIDVTGGKLKRFGLRIADPSVTVSCGIFEVLHEHNQRTMDEEVMEGLTLPPASSAHSKSSLLLLESISDLSVDINNCVLKYTSSTDQSRSLSLSVRETVVSKRDDVMEGRVAGLALVDQQMKSALRTSQLAVAVKYQPGLLELSLSSDSVQTTLSLQDALWWRNHFGESLRDLKSTTTNVPPSPGSPSRSLSVWCSLEVASLVCDLVDIDSFQSTLSVQFLTFSKTASEMEFGVESLCFAAPGTDIGNASFDRHQWGQSVFVGVALVQYKPHDTNPCVLICVDDCKIEWSDRLAKQVHQLLLKVQMHTPTTRRQPEQTKRLSIRANTKRTALFSVCRESSFLLFICDELALESSAMPREFAVSARSSRIGLGHVRGSVMVVDELRAVQRMVPQADDGADLPWRTWNQTEKDRRKLDRRKAFEEKRNERIKLVGEAEFVCISAEQLTAATRDITVSSNSAVYLSWSPLLHRLLYHMKCVAKSTFSLPKSADGVRVAPRLFQLKLLTNHSVDLDLELPGYHRMIWRIPSLTFDLSSPGLSALSPQLIINMDGYDIVTAANVCITRRPSDVKMDALRRGFGGLVTPSNKVWTWAADSFVFHLPFEFNFHAVFDEFINCFKWIKVVHEMKKKPFTAESPLPADIRIVFKEVRLEMDDDPFENLLQTNHELKEDEVYECERRRQMLADRLIALKKTNPYFPQSKMEELEASLQEKHSSIYIERWRKAGSTKRPLFVSKWTGWEMRAFADASLHGTDACTKLMHAFDPRSFFPTDGLHFSTLWARGVEFDMDEWSVHFKDYPMPYLLAKDMHYFGTLVGAEQFEEGGRSLRERTIELPTPWESHTVYRNMSPLKFYYDIQCESSEYNCTYGPCWEPCLSMISFSWNNISAPSRDPSPPLPFWDKMRFLLHGRFSWLSNKVVTTMLASPDPYNTTETVEMLWEDYGLDWALGEMRIRSRFSVFMRTASRYDDSRILMLPNLRLRVGLDWICGGDPNDHHAVTLCAPHRLPHCSTDHDSYRAFRSQHLDLIFNFDVAPGANGGSDRIPQVLLYANTFRSIEYLLNTMTMKNRTIKRGRVFGTPCIIKPQLSKHFRNVQVSVNFPKFFITYWMSHSSDFGFRVISDGLNLLASLKLTMSLGSDTGITRRRTYAWSPQHVSATLWGTKVLVFGNGRSPTAEDDEGEDNLLLGISRVTYVRENSAGRESAVHRLTAHDLRASWTASIRDACLSIADGAHRAHMLRRILSNDAIKILKLHMEEERLAPPADVTSSKEMLSEDKGHRRGYSISDTNQSMLNQLIDEASTKLIAHCEQATDVPSDSLQGVLQSTADDVQMINWQIDLLNSQAVLKGCETDGFVLLTAARASLTQKMHKCVWRSGQLLGKKSWSAVVSGMQYFAPVAMSSGQQNRSQFRWLPRELIEEKVPESGQDSDYLRNFIASGEAVGGVVQDAPSPGSSEERLQLQRIVSRCSCQIYFCYFSEELKTDALEETGVPKMEPESSLRNEETGVDCLTLKHNMLEASTSSDQYEMVVDIVNNLVLFIDPKKKELAENRRKLRFECQLSDMHQMRDSIVEQQSQLRDIVSIVRSLERQLFYVDSQEENGDKRREIVEEMEEYKARQLQVSDQLAIYISCYKQRQVEATRAVVHCVEEDEMAAVARRFEVCFEDCIWRLTETDGQIALAETQIRNFIYTRTMRIDNSGEHLFEVGSIRVSNLLPDTIYKDTLHRDERVQTRQPAIRLLLRDMAPVAGICVKEHFEVNISPMVAQLTYQFFEKVMGFFFPGRNIHKDDNLEAVDENTPKFSLTRRIAGTLSMRSGKSAQVERKASTLSGKPPSKSQPQSQAMNDIDKMRQRADQNNFFLYIKIPEVPFVVSYKGNKDKNIEDVDRFSFLFPLCEFHERNWTWLDLSLAVKQRCKRVLLQQFMRQKLLRNRLLTSGPPEAVEGISEEDKKRIALGTTSAIEKKKKK